MPCWAHMKIKGLHSIMDVTPSHLHDLRPIPDFHNIIFDLGGVILNIDYHLTIRAFEQLGMSDFGSHFTQLRQTEIFDRFERGEVNGMEFRNALRPHLRPDVTDIEIDDAWNAMLLDLPAERLRLLESIAKTKQIFLLSNTNRIHVEAFERDTERVHGTGLSPFFRQVYYSCDVGMRKPEERIFRHVMERHRLIPEETLFIDDSPQHVEGAMKAGLVAYHLTGGETIIDLFGHLS